MKKVLAIALALVFTLTLFTACKGTPGESDPAAEANNAAVPEGAVMQVGGYSISGKEYNYIFCSQLWEFYSTYYDYMSYMGLDLTKSLKEQSYPGDETMTWAEFFMDSTENLLTQIYCFYNAAKAENMELNETYSAQIDAYVLSMTEAAQEAEQTLDEYLSASYGPGMTEADYREFLHHRFLATQYCDEKLGTIIYSDEEYEAYYAENKASIDRVTFRIFTVTEDHLPEDFAADTEDAVATAVKERAEAFAKDLTSQEEFVERAYEYAPEEEKSSFESDSATLAANIAASSLADGDMKTWLFDASRVAGEVSVHATATTSYTVCYYVSGGRDESNLASMRHILLTVSEEEGKSDAEVSAAINALYEQWKAEGQTEESFIALANANTEDTGSQTTGGLYEDFARGYMVSEIDSWIYAEGRKKGDSAVIKTTYGYHLVWFLGYGEVAWKSDCFVGLQDADYVDLLAELQVKYAVTYAENHRDSVGNMTF